MSEFGFGQSVQKLSEYNEKVLFYETYFEEVNMNRIPLIWSNLRKSVILRNLLRRE